MPVKWVALFTLTVCAYVGAYVNMPPIGFIKDGSVQPSAIRPEPLDQSAMDDMIKDVLTNWYVVKDIELQTHRLPPNVRRAIMDPSINREDI